MSRVRRAAHRTGAVVSALVLVAATGAVVVLGPDAAAGIVGAAPSGAAGVHDVEVPASDATLACPAPATLTDRASVGDDQFDATPTPTTTRLGALVLGAAGADATTGGLDGGSTPLTVGADAGVLATDVDAARTLSVPAEGDAGTAAAATVTSTTTEGDLRGLTAASCSYASTDLWLVGGGTEVGSSTRLVLQNPGSTTASVALSVWGPSGLVEITGSDRFVVPAGEQVVTAVEAGAAEQKRIAVHLTSEGGLVTAYLQHSTVEGIVAQGVDDVTAGPAPATEQVVPGVLSVGEAVDDRFAPRLRVLAPGDADGTLDVTLLGPDGPVSVPGLEDLPLEAGIVTDVGLGGLPAGTYTVRAAASVPVVAGVELFRAGEQDPDSTRDAVQHDRAWIAASDRTDRGQGTIALAGGSDATVSVGAVGESDSDDVSLTGEVTAYGDDGTALGSQDLDVPAGTTTDLDLAALADGGTVRGLRLTVDATSGARAAWGALLSAGPRAPGAAKDAPGSLVAAVSPVPDAPGTRTVTVQRDDAVVPVAP